MNQIFTDKEVAVPKLYIFDFDNTIVKHSPDCMKRVPSIAGVVVNAFTGLPQKEGAEIAIQSFLATGDGFAPFKERYGEDAYFGMHRNFNSIVNFSQSGFHDPELPVLIKELNRFAHVCVASHCTQKALENALTELGYANSIKSKDILGLEALEGFKHDPQSDVFERICEGYDVLPAQAHLIEDSQRNIDAALTCGIGGATLINDEQTTIDFVRGALERFHESPRYFKPVREPA